MEAATNARAPTTLDTLDPIKEEEEEDGDRSIVRRSNALGRMNNTSRTNVPDVDSMNRAEQSRARRQKDKKHICSHVGTGLVLFICFSSISFLSKIEDSYLTEVYVEMYARDNRSSSVEIRLLSRFDLFRLNPLGIFVHEISEVIEKIENTIVPSEFVLPATKVTSVSCASLSFHLHLRTRTIYDNIEVSARW